MLMLLLTGSAWAQALAERIPADASVYIGFQGGDALKAPYAKSHLKTILDNCTVLEFVQKQLPAMLEKQNANDEQASAIIQGLFSISTTVGRSPSAMYLGPIDFGDFESPKVQVAILCQAGAASKDLRKKVDELLIKAKSEDADEKWTTELLDDALLVSFGNVSADAKLVLAGKASAKSLAQSAVFQKTVAQVDKSAAVVVYQDIASVRQAALNAVAKGEDQKARELAPKIVEAYGLNGLTQAAFSSGFAGKKWEDQFYLGIDGPRKGILTLFDAKAIDLADLKIVPKNAPGVSAYRLDFANLWKQIRDGVGAVDPEQLKQFDQGVAMAEQQIKLSIEKDIIAPLGSEWIVYRTVRPNDATVPLGFVVINKLNDAEKFTATLAALEKLVAGFQFIPLTKQKFGDVEGTVVSFGQVSVGWIIVNGHFVVSMADELEDAVKQIQGGKESILDNADFAALQKDFGDPAKKAILVDFGDPKQAYIAFASSLDTMIRGASSEGIEIPNSIIPDAEAIASALVPGGGVVWSDAAGVHLRSTSAFPGSAFICGQQTGFVPVAAVGTAALLPSLGKSRELSNRSYEASNLRGVAQSCYVWAADHNDQMPEHVAQLVAAGQITPKQLVSKRSKTLPAELTADQMAAAQKDWTTIKKVIEEHCDVVYLGAGTKSDTDGDQVLGYFDPKKVPTKAGMNIVFGDVHAEWIRPEAIAEIFKKANEARKEKKYPEIAAPAIDHGVKSSTTRRGDAAPEGPSGKDDSK